MMVERQARRAKEQAISIAMFLGADRELDSSISIKSIVSHLFQIYLSLLRTKTKRYSQPPQTSRANQEIETHTQRQRDDERRKEQHHQQAVSLSLTTTLTHEPDHEPQANLSRFVLIGVHWCLKTSCSSMYASFAEREITTTIITTTTRHIKGTRRSRTRSRSESSTSPMTHRPAIESSSSSRLLASSMMEHIDGDVDAT